MNLDHLNSEQRQAVVQTEGPIMVLAGAGSGKTRTLVTRISYLLNEKNVSPFKILALTFSNKAAGEMRERVASEVNLDVGALQITTFHSFCARLLRSEARYLGLSKNFSIYDTSESKSIAKGILNRRGISTKETPPSEILYFIDDIKNQGHYPGRTQDDYEIDENDEYFAYYLEYESELLRANALDFGGLITAVIQLFEKFPEVLERYQNRFKYLLVDEYQDTNRAQYRLISMLSKKTRNICVVGDEDQSIYSWRGADIRNILDFEQEFPDAKTLKLEQNYRSTKNIIEAATHVISRNSMRKGKEMWTENDRGESLSIIECINDKEESSFIADEVMKLRRSGVSPKEIAVFYRTNSQSRLIEDSLRKFNIHYRVVGGVKFYERKEIKDLLAYLRLVINKKDSLALSRIINIPARGIGATSLKKFEAEAIKENSSLYETVVAIADNPSDYSHIRLSAKVKSSLNSFVTLISELQQWESNGVKPSEIYEKVLHESGYYQFLKAHKDYESIARLENLEELTNAITQFENINPGAGITGFLETITLDSSSNNDEKLEEGEVSLMTVHGAKGLEFDYVFVSGVEENVFPSYRSLEEGGTAEEEERRLFYVAMTRAMKRLYLCFAGGRMLFGQLKFNGPSRFLHEIPSKFYEWKKIGSGKSQFFGGSEEEFDEFSQENPYDEEEEVYYVKKETPASYPKGVKVVHSLYGEGKVLETDGIGAEEKVVIQFKDGAKKKFLVKFTPLSLI